MESFLRKLVVHAKFVCSYRQCDLGRFCLLRKVARASQFFIKKA